MALNKVAAAISRVLGDPEHAAAKKFPTTEKPPKDEGDAGKPS